MQIKIEIEIYKAE